VSHNLSETQGPREMHVTLTVVVGDDNHTAAGRMLAKCKELGVETCAGDRDGRRWMQISGIVDEQGLAHIVDNIARPELKVGH
jgi:hypothetical protein